MEIVEAKSDLLCNRQVLELLKNYTSKKQTNLATILYETTSYLESSPVAGTTIENVIEFLDVIRERGYNLTKLEKIQLINLRPENDAELQLIVDNIDEKLDEQKRCDILELVQTKLFKPVIDVDTKHQSKKTKT